MCLGNLRNYAVVVIYDRAVNEKKERRTFSFSLCQGSPPRLILSVMLAPNLHRDVPNGLSDATLSVYLWLIYPGLGPERVGRRQICVRLESNAGRGQIRTGLCVCSAAPLNDRVVELSRSVLHKHKTSLWKKISCRISIIIIIKKMKLKKFVMKAFTRILQLSSKSYVSNRRPGGQMWSTKPFCVAHSAEFPNLFFFFN